MQHPQMIFVNLPVTDVAKATAFHEAMGAKRDPRFCDETASMVSYSDAIHVMVLSRARFADFTSKPIIDAHEQVQVMLCLSANSRDEVDSMVQRAGGAGGRMDPNPVQDYGFMYGRSYEDPDGHIFEVAWMDVDAATATRSQA